MKWNMVTLCPWFWTKLVFWRIYAQSNMLQWTYVYQLSVFLIHCGYHTSTTCPVGKATIPILCDVQNCSSESLTDTRLSHLQTLVWDSRRHSWITRRHSFESLADTQVLDKDNCSLQLSSTTLGREHNLIWCILNNCPSDIIRSLITTTYYYFIKKYNFLSSTTLCRRGQNPICSAMSTNCATQ